MPYVLALAVRYGSPSALGIRIRSTSPANTTTAKTYGSISQISEDRDHAGCRTDNMTLSAGTIRSASPENPTGSMSTPPRLTPRTFGDWVVTAVLLELALRTLVDQRVPGNRGVALRVSNGRFRSPRH